MVEDYEIDYLKIKIQPKEPPPPESPPPQKREKESITPKTKMSRIGRNLVQRTPPLKLETMDSFDSPDRERRVSVVGMRKARHEHTLSTL